MLLIPAVVGTLGTAIMTYINFWDMLKIDEAKSWRKVLKIGIWGTICFLLYFLLTFLTILIVHLIPHDYN